MRIPRLLIRLLIWLGVLITSVLLLLWAAPAAAQSARSPQAAPAAAFPHSPVTIPSWDGRTRIPVPGSHPKAATAGKQAPSALNLKRPRVFSVRPGALQRFQLQPQSPPVLLSLNPASNGERCYTVREYRFQRDNGSSDATTFKNYDACSPASQFHLRAAVSTRPPLPAPNARPIPALPHCGFAYGNVCPPLTPAGASIMR
jgi:hypothetical protein